MAANSDPHEVSSLRGPEAQHIGRTFWLVAGILLIVVLASIVTVSFISAANDNARIDRLKSHGVPVVVTVTGCVGNIGGSGSNAAGYTCRGEYRVNGVHYHEVIGSKNSSSNVGSRVRAVADPAQPSTIELATALARSSASASVYVVPGLLALLLVVLALVLVRRQKLTAKRTLI
jgi:hypothetical protein